MHAHLVSSPLLAAILSWPYVVKWQTEVTCVCVLVINTISGKVHKTWMLSNSYIINDVFYVAIHGVIAVNRFALVFFVFAMALSKEVSDFLPAEVLTTILYKLPAHDYATTRLPCRSAIRRQADSFTATISAETALRFCVCNCWLLSKLWLTLP